MTATHEHHTNEQKRNQKNHGTRRAKTEAVSNASADINDTFPHFSPPQVSLPKGGGAIQNIDEKFSINQATGTAAIEIPIYTSPSRQAFHPNLSLMYNSGTGNGPFGLGFSLSLPMITRKTAKGIPTYCDKENSDTFIFSGAEDLVPMYVKRDGIWTEDVRHKREANLEYEIKRYRPRIEGSFIRIERWTDVNTGMSHWRSITNDQVTTIYGKSEHARIAHPKHPEKVFQWKVEQSFDMNGNIISYEYKRENSDNVPNLPHEIQRLKNQQSFQNSYLKRILYGNKTPFQPNDWLFEVVFDYGEHACDAPTPEETREWKVRKDPFSTYKSGFEIRTYRLCERVLQFHHIDELHEQPYLVRSTNFTYKHERTMSTLIQVKQSGFQKINGIEGYEQKSFPPLDLNYSQVTLKQTLEYLDGNSSKNVPSNIDGVRSMWVDLDGEGLSGILTQEKNSWYYKRNEGDGQLGILERVEPVPSLGLENQEIYFIDLSGNGQMDLVQFETTQSGFYERTNDGSWQSFVPLQSVPNINWKDPNLRFIDLTGDGRADILMTEDHLFTYYPSEGKKGFGLPKSVHKVIDEEEGASLVFSDQTQSIYLADMCGDGLTDIVRIRNGDICYWPNLGYGKFGEKITMDRAPQFTWDDQFEHNRLRLADIDGSGTTDLIYLNYDSVRIWFNEAGNSWSSPHEISSFPPVDHLSSVQVIDLLGNGTACLVWSSSNSERTMAYIDLLGGVKPNLLVSINNNLGKEQEITYAPSTKFYLQDKKQSNPWITKLPFPVHVVEHVATIDHVSKAKYTTRYSYHHGYYDGVEREFHGFGYVQQWDTDQFEQTDIKDTSLDQAPVHTKTWFHTGAFIDQTLTIEQYRNEYYANDLEAFKLPDIQFPAQLSTEEVRQACRALKGKVLRTEIYGLDETSKSVHPYQVSEHTYQVRLLQSMQEEQDAVFHVVPSETLSYYYERNPEDPRMMHELILEVDDFSNITKSVTVAYPRRQHLIPNDADFEQQRKTLITYTEMDYVNLTDDDRYQIGVLIEQRLYEILSFTSSSHRLFNVSDFIHPLNQMMSVSFEGTTEDAGPKKRLFERAKILYWNDELSAPLPHGKVGVRALPYETYQMTFTDGMVKKVYGSHVDSTRLEKAGYVEMDGSWWKPSGRLTYSPQQFYMPVKYSDPLGALYVTTYDSYSLFPIEVVSPTPSPSLPGNRVKVHNNYRVLQVEQITDPNGNRSAVHFDALGIVIATAIMGKTSEQIGDSLREFEEVFFEDISESIVDPQRFLQSATTRYIVDFYRFQRDRKPVCTHIITRETHVSELQANEETKVQQQVIYWDGLNRTIMTKTKTEAGEAIFRNKHDHELVINLAGDVIKQHTESRWIGSGRTIFNNKGNPVKQYEPFFSDSYDFEEEQLLAEWGVTPLMVYDPLGRMVRFEAPNGTFSKDIFDAWSHEVWDANDTVKESRWYSERGSPDPTETEPSDPNARAAWLTATHANTPTVHHLDSLGRSFLTEEDNDADGIYRTRSEIDIQGNEQSVYDAKQREVMVSQTDMLGRPIYMNSIDAGERWEFLGMYGTVMQWNSGGYKTEYEYDLLGRLTKKWVNNERNQRYLAEENVYGESQENAEQVNLKGALFQTYDQAGVITYEKYDFKGNVVMQHHTLVETVQTSIDWTENQSLEPNKYSLVSKFDALNRLNSHVQPDNSKLIMRYNEINLLSGVDALLHGSENTTAFVEEIVYNAKGQREKIRYRNKTETTYTYDPHTFLLVNLVTSRLSDGTKLQDLEYTYDPVGNITEIQDRSQQTIFFNNSVVSATTKYAYDPLYRLIKAEGRERARREFYNQPNGCEIPIAPLPHLNDRQAIHRYSEQYHYDEVGNLLEMIHRIKGVGSHSFDWNKRYYYETGNNRLTSTSMPGDVQFDDYEQGTYLEQYAYDANGNMIQMPHLQELHWDDRDQLQRVELGGGGQEFYLYNTAGARVRKVHKHNGATVEERIYLGSFEIYRKHRNGHLINQHETLHIMDGNARIALVETVTYEDGLSLNNYDPVIRYQINNHLQSSCLELDENGAVITYEEYFPFGGISFRSGRSEAETSLKRYKYTGKEKDEQTGFYYYGARYYVSWLGRWTSTDPAGLIDSLSLYVYVANNPIIATDPDGRQLNIEDGSNYGTSSQRDGQNNGLAPDDVCYSLFSAKEREAISDLSSEIMTFNEQLDDGVSLSFQAYKLNHEEMTEAFDVGWDVLSHLPSSTFGELIFHVGEEQFLLGLVYDPDKDSFVSLTAELDHASHEAAMDRLRGHTQYIETQNDQLISMSEYIKHWEDQIAAGQSIAGSPFAALYVGFQVSVYGEFPSPDKIIAVEGMADALTSFGRNPHPGKRFQQPRPQPGRGGPDPSQRQIDNGGMISKDSKPISLLISREQHAFGNKTATELNDMIVKGQL